MWQVLATTKTEKLQKVFMNAATPVLKTTENQTK